MGWEWAELGCDDSGMGPPGAPAGVRDQAAALPDDVFDTPDVKLVGSAPGLSHPQPNANGTQASLSPTIHRSYSRHNNIPIVARTSCACPMGADGVEHSHRHTKHSGRHLPTTCRHRSMPEKGMTRTRILVLLCRVAGVGMRVVGEAAKPAAGAKQRPGAAATTMVVAITAAGVAATLPMHQAAQASHRYHSFPQQLSHIRC